MKSTLEMYVTLIDDATHMRSTFGIYDTVIHDAYFAFFSSLSQAALSLSETVPASSCRATSHKSSNSR